MKVLAHRYSRLVQETLSRDDARRLGFKWEEAGLYQVRGTYADDYFLADGRVVRTILRDGFVYNLRSGPAIIDPWFPKGGELSFVWAPHDGHYNEGRAISRSLADGLLCEGLRLEGLGILRRNLAWTFVRAGGGPGWGYSRQAREGLVEVSVLTRAGALEPLVVVEWDRTRGKLPRAA